MWGLKLLVVVAHIAPVVSFYVFHLLAVVGLHCCTQAFSICREWELLTSCGGQLLTAVASLLWIESAKLGSQAAGGGLLVLSSHPPEARGEHT